MANVSVLNTDAQISGKTLLLSDAAQSVTGLLTFSRSPSPPFGVTIGSAMVANLDAEFFGGFPASVMVRTNANNTFTGNNIFTTGTLSLTGSTITVNTTGTSTWFSPTLNITATTFNVSTTLNMLAANTIKLFRSDGARSGTLGHDNNAAYWQNSTAGDNWEFRNNAGATVGGLLNAGGFILKDGITAPSTLAGFGLLYIDTADGDLKIKFGDGVVKTIVVDV